ncbi:hypothetical protein [Pseudomonas sp. S9]|uniref:hypothetical protein n=1 Tax=Pseudomonas sp. S9 TaxID=686578 RepID=UPI0002556DD9|nr:hypothetical protein [Pseudomonas sp. S9]
MLKLWIGCITTAVAISGCSGPGTKTPDYLTVTRPNDLKPLTYKYESGKSAAWNFQARLGTLAFSCGLEASSGYRIARMGMNDQAAIYAKSLQDCFKHAAVDSDQAVEAFKQSNPPKNIFGLGKDLYAKWSAYMSTLGVYSPQNLDAKNSYEAAQSALLAEEKF